MELQKNLNVALISPSKEVYSETFIRAQKELLPFHVFYYFDGFLPKQLEGYGSITSSGRIKKASYKIRKKLGLTSLSYVESALAKSFKKNKIDVVLAQYGPVGEAVLNVCESIKVPVVVHFHGYDASRHDVIEDNNKFKKTFKYAKAVIAVSTSMEKKLLEMGCPREKLFYNVYGPNDSFLEVVPKLNKHHFIGIGRFTDKKAPYYTILAFAKVIKKFPDAKLTIAGNGELWNTCKNLIRHLEIQNSVNLPGVITPEEYREYLENSIGFVQHSIIAENGDSEGTPLAVLEASAAGLPVISTIHAGISDVIINGKTGILVKEHDVDAMANAMISVLENKVLTSEMGRKGKENIGTSFSMRKYIEGLANIIINSH